MGSQITWEYALGGHEVLVSARRPGLVQDRLDATLGLIREHSLFPDAEIEAAQTAISVAPELEAAFDCRFDVVVESVTEDLDLKASLLARAREASPDAILASNTSSLSITALGRAIGDGSKVVGTHYWNPPMLMPPVEVVAGEDTDAAILDQIVDLIASLGKEPIVVRRDVPGFIWNRLQHALLREVLWLVKNDVASPEAVDRVVRSGLSRRSRYTGPFETMALGGLDAWRRVAENLFPVLSDDTDVGDLQQWIPYAPEDLEAAKARRDAGLVRELKSRA
jgi:3-hydroxyacyl-CoA dehydrogenase